MEERAVITYIRSGDDILLIHKKTGHGAGKVNAPGGHIEPGETPVQAAVRECMEETGIIPVNPVLKGVLDFPFTDGLDLKGYVFYADEFFGSLKSCDEADPFWCPVDKMPYDQMWEDDKLWIPALLDGKCFSGYFTFDGDNMRESRLQIFDNKKKILCFGSSSTWGYDWHDGSRLDEETRWPCVVKKYIPECFEITENGVNGRTVMNYLPMRSPTNGKQALERAVRKERFDGVIILLGNNDIMAVPDISINRIAEGMGEMADIVRASNPDARVFLASAVPISTKCDEDNLFASFFESQVNKSQRLAGAVKEVAERKGCTFIEAGKYATCDGTDGIHFDAASNKNLAIYMGDFLNQEIWER